MSKFGSPSDRKPPLYQSQYQLRSRRVLRSNVASFQTPQASLVKSQQLPSRLSNLEGSELRPEYRSISCELQALAKMVKDEFGSGDMGNPGFVDTFTKNSTATVFERGRFYEEYSARRNERLKRKKGERGEEKEEKRASNYNLGVTVESAKRRDSKKLDGLRKTVPETFMALPPNTVNMRYSLRSSSSKENKKPPTGNTLVERSATGGGQKVSARKTRKV